MTTTDRTGADTATFEAELARLDRLDVADVAADAALQRVLDLADEMEAAGDLPILSEFDRGVGAHQRDTADRIRAAVAGPQRDHDDLAHEHRAENAAAAHEASDGQYGTPR